MNTFALTETSNLPHHHHWSTIAKQCLTNFTRLWIPQSHPVCASKKLLNCSTLICAFRNLKPQHTIGPLTRRTVGMPNELKKLKGWKKTTKWVFFNSPNKSSSAVFWKSYWIKGLQVSGQKRGIIWEHNTEDQMLTISKRQVTILKRQEIILKRQPRSFALSGSRATAAQ